MRMLGKVAILFLLVFAPSVHAQTAVPAFPGAEGFGSQSVGGRGGKVILVTNLNDAGAGSLRACIIDTAPRTCVFTVSGRIVLNTPLEIIYPYITIAGQTAPGNGITVSAGSTITRGIMIVKTHDVIIRYIGLRPGLNSPHTLVESEYNLDSLTIGDLNVEPYNVVVDHVSMAWATDEIINTARKHHDLDIQWSIMSEVNDCDGDPTNNKCGGKGPLFHTGTAASGNQGGGKISFHHNLISSNQGRNPLIKNTGGVNDIVNNVIFPLTRNDGTAIGPHLDNTHGLVEVNLVGNYIIGDPARLSDQRYIDFLGVRMVDPNVAGRTGGFELYVQGNIGPMKPNVTCPGLSQKACELLIINPRHLDNPNFNQRGDANLSLDGQGNLLRLPAPQVTTQDANTAYSQIIATGGAGKSARLDANGNWVAYRDSIDTKIISDVVARRAVQISGQPWPPNTSYWPSGTTAPSYADADNDGMSDTWEQAKFGHLNQGSATASTSNFDNDGYTDLEEFLNVTDPRVPNGGTLPSPTPGGSSPTPSIVPTPACILGDLNCDGQVTLTEVRTIIQNFFTNILSMDNNGDGVVNSVDLAGAFTNMVLPSSPPVSTPTPGPTSPPVPTPPGGLRAFPTAEGFGANSTGGRGGRVIQVTTLNDNGSDTAPLAGSLRACINASGPRTCVFTVGGYIRLNTQLIVRNPNLTIAGQTAPGDGITIRNNAANPRGPLKIRTNNVIVRYVKIRPGLNPGQAKLGAESDYNIDAVTIGELADTDANDIILDHVSMSWATDEIYNTAYVNDRTTLQWSITSEGIFCKGDQVQPELGGECVGTGPLLGGTEGKSSSFHHNLMSNNKGRNPMLKGQSGVTDIVNNIGYIPHYKKWNSATEFEMVAVGMFLSDEKANTSVKANVVGNMMIEGNTSVDGTVGHNLHGLRVQRPLINNGGGTNEYQIYLSGNISPFTVNQGNPSYPHTYSNNIEHLFLFDGNPLVDPRTYIVPTRLAAPQVVTTDANTALAQVLGEAGANRRLRADGVLEFHRDPTDSRIISEVQNRTPIYLIMTDSHPPSDAAWPVLSGGTPYADSDADGMADQWETTQFGNLSTGSASASTSDFDGDGYTDLEEFLNGTNPRAAN